MASGYEAHASWEEGCVGPVWAGWGPSLVLFTVAREERGDVAQM